MDGFTFTLVSFAVIILSILIFIIKKIGLHHSLLHKVDTTCTRNGGELVAQVLKSHGIDYIFTLVGGHISPILVSCENLGIKVVDTRHEVNAVFAADAVARLSGKIGVAAVTAGPGVTNTVTAVKNAQMAESPILLMGGAAATLLKGRGALQDIDQLCLFKPLCKYTATVERIADIIPTLLKAIQIAQSGTPGPVFVEFPINVLYPYQIVQKEAGVKSNPKGLMAKAVNWYIQNSVNSIFAGAWDVVSTKPLKPYIPLPTKSEVEKAWSFIEKAKKPVVLIGSQAILPPVSANQLRESLEYLGIPCFLGGMARGLLGRNNALHIRQRRRDALQEADVVLLIGSVCDFRLSYGRVFNKKSKLICVNRNREQLYKNSDVFWKPSLAIQGDSASLIVELAKHKTKKLDWDEWSKTLKDREIEKEKENEVKADKIPNSYINPVKLLHELENMLDDNSILVADGGDFVGTAAYILRPRAPLSWLDPGAFGTLGVGGGFALGAKLVRPDSEVWIVWGDGSSTYSIAEYDTFKRFKLPVIGLIGNDACWSQIAREQVPMFQSSVACDLLHTDYDKVVEGFGCVGYKLDKNDVTSIRRTLQLAKDTARGGQPVVINALIGKSDFRAGSISV